MAITKSAKKAIRQSDKRKQHNLVYKNKIKGLIKEARGLILAKRIDEAKKVLPKLYQALDKAAKVGVIKKNTASRKKSRLTKLTERK
jgi:small subunit ribosomal protein S20